MNEIEKICEKWAADNAIKYGEAKIGSVMGMIMNNHPELRKNAKSIKEIVQKKVNYINSLSNSELKDLISSKYPKILEEDSKQKKEQETKLPELPNAKQGKVVTRLPPEPSGYLHIGHAYSGYINWYYAKKYDGKLILRFEDTNPNKAKKEFYDHIKNAYRYLKIDWDQEIIESERLEVYYKYAEKLIEQGYIYACSCDKELTQKLRHDGKACEHRNMSKEETKKIWKAIKDARKYKEGDYVFRLKGELQSKKAALRDPTVFRITDDKHPLQKYKYRLWPLYDFAVSLEDSLLGITHVLRSEEFVQKIPLQNYIKRLLGFPLPEYIHYSRLRIKGTPVSKRKIRKLIEDGIVDGWSDIRLSTIEALKRRGIVPETIKDIVFKLSLSKSQGEISWYNILAANRKRIDDHARRYFGVIDPIMLSVSNAPTKHVTLPCHPDHEIFGTRRITTRKTFYLSREDVFVNVGKELSINEGDKIRLKDLYNIEITSKSKDKLVGHYLKGDNSVSYPKLQWVTDKALKLELKEPSIKGLLNEDGSINSDSLSVKTGLIEPSILNIKEDTEKWIIQLERVTFGRIDEFRTQDEHTTVIINTI